MVTSVTLQKTADHPITSEMSEENLYKQKFEIKQWPTRSVTLYPTRATVVRQIEGVKLKVS